jgi:hypothetical protein
MYLETSSGHLGNVEHLVNEMAQMARRRRDPLDRLSLTRAELSVHAVAEHLDETDDCVKRCSQLM